MDRRKFVKTGAGLFVAVAPALIKAPVLAGQMSLLGAGGATGVAATTTWNPADKDSNITLSGGNLIATNTGSGLVCVRSVASHSTGKYFASFVINTVSAGSAIGIANATQGLAASITNGLDATSGVAESGVVWFNGGGIESFTAAVNGDTVDMAVDFGAKLIWFRTNGSAWNSGGTANPATGVGGGSFSGINAGPYFVICAINSSRAWTANFGASAYPFAAPSGFINL